MSEGEIMKIAITGTIGGGKSQVSKYLKQKGYPVFDADKLVHTYYDFKGRLYHEVIKLLGPSILNEDETINRDLMANIIFNDQKLLEKVESLVFPTVSKHMDDLYDSQEGLVFFEVPLLYEAKLESTFDKVIMVTAPQLLRYERLINRGMRLEDIKRRSARHLDETTKIERADYVILNDEDIESLYKKVEAVLERLEGKRG